MPQVKVVFESEGEIRRYILPSGPGAFQELCNKVREVLGKNSQFRIYWKDSEGDFIVVDSDVELQGAFDSLATSKNSTDNIRLYARLSSGVSASGSAYATSGTGGVSASGAAHASDFTTFSSSLDAEMKDETTKTTEDEQPQTEKKEEGPKVHEGISCDGCGGEVKGIRYKCTKCANYDLCETCQGKGFHAEHQLENIAESRQEESWNLPWINMGFGGGCQRGRRRGAHSHEPYHSRRFPGMPGFRHHGPGGGFPQMPNMPQMPQMPDMNWTFRPEGCCSNDGATWNSAKTVDEIAKTLEDMGIKADGGVIRDLIEQFHGDIAKIIEAMN